MRKLTILSALAASVCTQNCIAQDLVADGKLSFINETGKTINVRVNNSTAGVPIPTEGLAIGYFMIHRICAANTTSCLVDFLDGEEQLGHAIFNANTGALESYEAQSPYTVELDINEVPLRSVTIGRES